MAVSICVNCSLWWILGPLLGICVRFITIWNEHTKKIMSGGTFFFLDHWSGNDWRVVCPNKTILGTKHFHGIYIVSYIHAYQSPLPNPAKVGALCTSYNHTYMHTLLPYKHLHAYMHPYVQSCLCCVLLVIIDFFFPFWAYWAEKWSYM